MAESAPTSYDELASVMESLPLLVREKRRRDQLSLRQAAAAMTLSAATLSRLENLDGVQLTAAIKIVRWLGEPASQDRERADG